MQTNCVYHSNYQFDWFTFCSISIFMGIRWDTILRASSHKVDRGMIVAIFTIFSYNSWPLRLLWYPSDHHQKHQFYRRFRNSSYFTLQESCSLTRQNSSLHLKKLIKKASSFQRDETMNYVTRLHDDIRGVVGGVKKSTSKTDEFDFSLYFIPLNLNFNSKKSSLIPDCSN